MDPFRPNLPLEAQSRRIEATHDYANLRLRVSAEGLSRLSITWIFDPCEISVARSGTAVESFHSFASLFMQSVHVDFQDLSIINGIADQGHLTLIPGS